MGSLVDASKLWVSLGRRHQAFGLSWGLPWEAALSDTARDNRRVIGRVSSPVFVGRRDELGVLEAAVDRAAAGTGAVVMIGAEAGMGKSRLVAEVGGCGAAGATMVICECPPLGDGELPYAPIVSALRTLLRARGADTLTGLDGVADRRARASAARVGQERSELGRC